MENSVFNILITKCRYNISDNHQSDVTINSFDISLLLFFNLHVQHYVRIASSFFFFLNNKKRIHIYLPTTQMLCVLWFQKFFAYRWFLFSIKCFIECHKLSKNTCTRTWMYVNWWFWFFFPLHAHFNTDYSALPYMWKIDKIKFNLTKEKKTSNHTYTFYIKLINFSAIEYVLTASSFNIFLTK